MGLIKDIYSAQFYRGLANSLSKSIPSFRKKDFMSAMMPDEFATMEWKQRMKHTTRTLHGFLPSGFAADVKQINAVIKQLRADGFGSGRLEFMFLPDYIETYGIDDLKNSVKALEVVTQYISCEFAARPFILKYGDDMLEEMQRWSLHKSHHVRRLSSEGSRPRLPWAMAIPALKADPSPVLPILRNLRSDPSDSVRRSVANNLNDIAKDHPDVVLMIAKEWKGSGKETDAVIRHGCRTLLKAGHPEALKYFGLDSRCAGLTGLQIHTPAVKMGDNLEFSFTVENLDSKEQNIRLEYKVYFLRGNGKLSGKVFKISERIYRPGEKAVISRRQSFRPITTRRYYAGGHRVSVLVNGEEKVAGEFVLK